MWQYNDFSKMTTKPNNSIICHSDTYLGADFSDGLKHWKYIKKEKKANGKWRYYYEVKDSFSDDISVREFEKVDDYGDKYGKYKSVDNKPSLEVDYKKTGKMIGGTSSLRTGGKNGSTHMEIKEGRIETDVIPAVQRAINNIGTNISRSVKRGQDFILKLFGRK